MSKFKKILLLVLVLPLVVTTVLLVPCFCSSAQASAADQVSIHRDHHCCCPGTVEPVKSSIIGEVAFYQSSLNQKVLSQLFAFSSYFFPAIEYASLSKFLVRSNLSGPPTQDIFLKNEVLRI